MRKTPSNILMKAIFRAITVMNAVFSAKLMKAIFVKSRLNVNIVSIKDKSCDIVAPSSNCSGQRGFYRSINSRVLPNNESAKLNVLIRPPIPFITLVAEHYMVIIIKNYIKNCDQY